jgi:Ni/Co efflux regulator RcnB
MRNLILAALAATVLTPVAASAQERDWHRDRPGDARDWRGNDRHDNGWRDNDHRGDRRDWGHDRGPDRGRDWYRDRDWNRDRQVQWHRDWRRDDWRGWRESNRDAFRVGRYYGPRGWTYRAITPGYRFAPTFYSQRYWIADPWAYRLPAAGPGMRWVRYGNDAVLVNVRNGITLEVLSNIFW